jgi:hypothetical protein
VQPSAPFHPNLQSRRGLSPVKHATVPRQRYASCALHYSCRRTHPTGGAGLTNLVVPVWQTTVDDSVSSVATDPTGTVLAVSSAAGEHPPPPGAPSTARIPLRGRAHRGCSAAFCVVC